MFAIFVAAFMDSTSLRIHSRSHQQSKTEPKKQFVCKVGDWMNNVKKMYLRIFFILDAVWTSSKWQDAVILSI